MGYTGLACYHEPLPPEYATPRGRLQRDTSRRGGVPKAKEEKRARGTIKERKAAVKTEEKTRIENEPRVTVCVRVCVCDRVIGVDVYVGQARWRLEVRVDMNAAALLQQTAPYSCRSAYLLLCVLPHPPTPYHLARLSLNRYRHRCLINIARCGIFAVAKARGMDQRLMKPSSRLRQ
ncbi:hypothetical protein WN48_02174 [Eufriesea mexicana]|uniref:Uncharacterized protein n=1 Tax=Eufriesea mexicana TaxID=516756 RepID=A0A310SQS9_9HYME|nr:hypothetical protein WN48_02174 [Eufriesea mexicana]